MDRLTTNVEGGGLAVNAKCVNCEHKLKCDALDNTPCWYHKIVNTLSEYELTRLTPAQIKELQSDFEACKRDLEQLLSRADYLGICWACFKNCKKGELCQPQWRGRSKENG